MYSIGFYPAECAPKEGTATASESRCAAVCVAVRCSVLQCVAVCCSVLQSVAECCSALQSVAECCSVLSHTLCTPLCSVQLSVPPRKAQPLRMSCSALQCELQRVAVCCVAECCSVLSHTLRTPFCSVQLSVPPRKAQPQRIPYDQHGRMVRDQFDQYGRMVREAVKVCRYTATHCTLQHALQHTAIHCNTMQHTAANHHVDTWFVHYNILQHALQHTATHCNTLQHTAKNHLRSIWAYALFDSLCVCPCVCLREFKWRYSRNTPPRAAAQCKAVLTVQHSATQCIEVQHTATHCNT